MTEKSEAKDKGGFGYPLLYAVCPDCNGDGKETCHNPDHGFIGMMPFHEIERLGCPVCGHDENHKVKNGGKCETCNGSGKVSVDRAKKFIDDMDYDLEIQEIRANFI